MRVERMLIRARKDAASIARSSVTVKRAGAPIKNRETGKLEPSWEVIYAGRGRLRFTAGEPREGDQAGQRFSDQSPTLSLPISGTSGIRVDDIVEFNDNPFDPAGTLLKLRVTGVHVQTHSTTRRLPVEVLNFS